MLPSYRNQSRDSQSKSIEWFLCDGSNVLKCVNPFVPNAPFLYPLKTSENRDGSNVLKCVNPFVPNAPFLYLLRTSENVTVFWCFQGVEKGCIGIEWIKKKWFCQCWRKKKNNLISFRHNLISFHFDLIWLKIFPALRDHDENKAFLLVLCYPCHMQSIICEFSC